MLVSRLLGCRATCRAILALHSFAQQFLLFFLRLGGAGLFTLSVVDALLFTPLANDVLLVALVSRNPGKVWLYVGLTVAGTVIGCWILDYFSRKGGEAGLKKTMSPKRIDTLKKWMSKRAAIALVLGSTMPPPFPFTAVVAGAAALQYPRTKLMAIIAVSRLARFAVLGYLAVRYGKRILQWANQPAVWWTVFGLMVISVVGSAWTIIVKIRQIRASRK